MQGGRVSLLLLAELDLVRACPVLGSTAESGGEGGPGLKSCPQGEKQASNRWDPTSSHLYSGCCKLILLAWLTYWLARNLKRIESYSHFLWEFLPGMVVFFDRTLKRFICSVLTGEGGTYVPSTLGSAATAADDKKSRPANQPCGLKCLMVETDFSGINSCFHHHHKQSLERKSLQSLINPICLLAAIGSMTMFEYLSCRQPLFTCSFSNVNYQFHSVSCR